MTTPPESQILTSSPASSIRRFPLYERSHSSPTLPSLAVHVPRITSTTPEPFPPSARQSDPSRPPTPHRGYSLAVPAALPPGLEKRQRRTSSVSDSVFGASVSAGGTDEKLSVAATRGSSATSSDDELERAEQGGGGGGTGSRAMGAPAGLRDVRSRETILSRRTGGGVARRFAPSPAPTAASASPCVFSFPSTFRSSTRRYFTLSLGETRMTIDFHDLVQVYQIIANRRANFDLLLWSVPSTSFAAQAFLFQTAFYKASFTDQARTYNWEKRHGVDPSDCAHGETWAKYRSVLPKRARHFKVLASIRGFTLWSNGMLFVLFAPLKRISLTRCFATRVIGMVALGVLVTSAIREDAYVVCPLRSVADRVDPPLDYSFQNCQNN
ncbi:hypothetical protein JCM11641_005116 [Rhodosporidiobolus odoratus]